MRQFFSWRIWGAFAALAVLAVTLKVVVPAGASHDESTNRPTPRTVQFVSLVYSVTSSNVFVINGGIVTGSADFVLDGQRTMHIYQGTPGEMACPDYKEVGRCVVLADLLGDAVVWFTLVPVATGLKVVAPPIVALLDGGIAQLANGWLVPHASVVDRSCPAETDSLAHFIRDYGPQSTTIIDVSSQQITQVKCAPSVTVSTTG